MSRKSSAILFARHDAFVPPPMHHFELKVDKRDVSVHTDFPLTKQNSAAYSSALIAHIKCVEEECSLPRPVIVKRYPAKYRVRGV